MREDATEIEYNASQFRDTRMKPQLPNIAYFTPDGYELKVKSPIPETLECPICHKRVKVYFGKKRGSTGRTVENRCLGFVRCQGVAYLVAIDTHALI